ncbi:hypothetical protein P0664_004775 [Salmonella enterica]|nr:hypothetical protein [Salmonella enterica]EKO8013800.1 hypothetical protein [Salmonella enterica]
MEKFKKIYQKTISFLYKNTTLYKKDLLYGFCTQPVLLYKPTADYRTILNLNDIFYKDAMLSWNDNLNEILTKLITVNSIHNAAFDFSKIQSLTSSKSFGGEYNGCIDGTWFPDLFSWGRGMYPAENLKAQTEDDWMNNIKHIEFEGFRRTSPIRITYYEWLDRYLASNCGGSHHAAMVVYQSIRDKFKYFREADIDICSIDHNAVTDLENNYYSFFAFDEVSQHVNSTEIYTYKLFHQFLGHYVSDNVITLPVHHYYKKIKMFFIPKNNLKMESEDFIRFLDLAHRAKRVILLNEYLKSPVTYHTEPYIHSLNNIYLGDPVREYRR